MFLEGLDLLKLVDDLLIQAQTHEELWTKINQLLRRCETHGIISSRKKVAYGKELIFAGHLITDQGIKPDPAKLGAIKRFPTPKDLTALRSFLGLANQLG